MESIKDRLLRETKQAVECNRKFIAVAEQKDGKEPVILIIPHSLMMAKVTAIGNWYGDDLRYQNKKIINWAFGSTFAELQENLG